MSGILVGVALVAALVGAAAGAAAAGVVSRRREDQRITAAIDPIARSLADLDDQFYHWTRREAVRARRSARDENGAVDRNLPPALRRAMERQKTRESTQLKLQE